MTEEGLKQSLRERGRTEAAGSGPGSSEAGLEDRWQCGRRLGAERGPGKSEQRFRELTGMTWARAEEQEAWQVA